MAESCRISRLLVQWSVCFLLMQSSWEKGMASADTHETPPYLLFTTQSVIYTQQLNSTTRQEVLQPAEFGVLGIDYHYRLNYMFWIDNTPNRPLIMRARLNGSELTTVVNGDLKDPTDLVVDWINNKVYWVDRGHRHIEEYDIISGHRRIVVSTGDEGQSSPVALALYPYPNYGWLYWSDTIKQSLETASVTGDGRRTFHGGVRCVKAITVHFVEHILYWINQCTYEIEAIRLDGDSSTHAYPFSDPIFFASGLTAYQNYLIWSDSSGVHRYNRDMEDEIVELVHIRRVTGVQVVHPSQQPQAQEYKAIISNTSESFTFSCTNNCIRGNCIPPGLCACDAGWRGDVCSIDKNECLENDGGCEFECNNTVGGFQCSCPTGRYLNTDQLTCGDFPSPTSSSSSSSSSSPSPTSFSPTTSTNNLQATTSTLAEHTPTPTLAVYVSEVDSTSEISSLLISSTSVISTSVSLGHSLISHTEGVTSVGLYPRVTSSTQRMHSREISSSPAVFSAERSLAEIITPTASSSQIPSASTSYSRFSSLSGGSPHSTSLETRFFTTSEEQMKPTSSELELQPSSTPAVSPIDPMIEEPKGNQRSAKSNNIVLMAGAASGLVVIIVVVVLVILITCLVCARKRLLTATWSPSSTKSDVAVVSTSIKTLPNADYSTSFSSPSRA